jgi:hypothetical protein
MTEAKTVRAPRHAVAETPTARPEIAVEPLCNLPGCDRTPEWQGLCSAHRQTHRGLADPKEGSRG